MIMFRKVLMTIGLLLMANFVLAQGTIKGTVTDPATKEGVPFANVVAMQDGKQIKVTRTDFEGNFTIKPIDVGQYDISVSCVGYSTYTWKGFNVKASGISVCNIDLTTGSTTLKEVIVETDKQPIIDVGDPATGKHISSEDIKHMPGTSVDNIVAAVGGVGYNDGSTGTARGMDGMVTNVSGIRKRTGVNVPKDAIAEIQVILGGTPASIGEAIGGTQIITLKPPTSQFHGSAAYRTILNHNLYNYLSLYLTGPVITKDILDENGESMGKRPVVGFRFTAEGQYRHSAFYRPRGYKYLVVNDALVREYEQNPISYDPVNGTVDYAAETGLYRDDFVELRRPTKKDFGGDASRVPNTQVYTINAELALDFRFSEYANLVLTGDFNFAHQPSNSLTQLNMSRSANGVTRSMGYAITADLTQRFPDPQPENTADNVEGSSNSGRAVQNVMYSIKAMYEVSTGHAYNETFGSSVNDAFKYGYNGRLETNQMPTYELNPSFNYQGISRAAHVQNNWYDVIDWSTYEPYGPNQVLANYNLQLLGIPDIAPSLLNIDNLRYFKGLANGDMPNNIYSLINNVGVQDGSLSFSRNQYIYVSAMAKADIKDHSLEMGFQYDRVDNSAYGLSAKSLWTIMRQNANRHISQMDLENPHFRWEGANLYVDYDRLYNPDAQSYFDRAMRDYLGWSGNYEGERTYLDVDRYTPEQYIEAGGIEMFSADELFNNSNSLVSYYGYDHTGKKYNSANWKLDDFFNPQDPKYRYLPSFHPTYMAGYIQDQFYVSDLIFNIGVRVDIFDGEQPVLKDPYLLYDSYTVGDLRKGKANYQGDIYAGAGDDWTVYVDAADAENPAIYGYRSGSNWYDANGVGVNSPSAIAGKSGKPTPYRTPDGQQALNSNNVASSAFTDYKPQVVVMPRIAFSFPVGEMSQFKASYDIISRRPSSSWQANYLSYLYMTQISSVSNPNLKPERITNYELDFEQALNKNSAISIAAYYKETRDLIQLVQYAGADPNQNYYSYDNIDFKTIKGLTLSYDLRQSKNIRVTANYTLQYAEGTGLPGNTMTELIKEGYTTLKMLNPISDDRRHEFKANLDFRYGYGDQYNGPVIKRVKKDKETGELTSKNIKLLQNFGVNLQAVAQSGRPYTRQYSHNQPTIVGSYNGARLPWSFFCDLQLDKTFPVKVGKRTTDLALVLTVNNVFNIRNVAGVYPVTGNPEDDGYLTDPETQTVINSYLDPQSYRDLYAISMHSGWNYTSPRTIMLQVLYSF